MHDDPPAEPVLDEFRDAIASLHRNGTHVGHLATKVESMRAGFLFRRQERVWLLLTRSDGSRDPIQEDYSPWTSVLELRQGRLDWASPDGDVQYEVRWLQGEERRVAWDRYGIVDDVGAYTGRTR